MVAVASSMLTEKLTFCTNKIEYNTGCHSNKSNKLTCSAQMSVRTYNPSVRVGNWNEDIALEEVLLSFCLKWIHMLIDRIF